MEGRRRPKKSLLMYDKVLFFSALLLLVFTLIYALDYVISGAVINGSDSFDAIGKVISFAKRLNVYFIFIVIFFVTTTLALIYTILLRSGKRRNVKTLDNVMIGFVSRYCPQVSLYCKLIYRLPRVWQSQCINTM